MTEYSLESYYCPRRNGIGCVPWRLLIGCPSNNPYTRCYKERSAVEDFFEPAFALSSKNVIKMLREFFRKKIVAGLDLSNTLDTPFHFAYRHGDLKKDTIDF
ncbi:MAG: hypothetical protein BYD32DRAFT_434211 [Podila humilis]|nr:MAG: hypothetical protein BYD32DRAFT_434211 [Podila humilis]